MLSSQHILAIVSACLSLVLQHTSGRHPFIVGWQRHTLGRQVAGSHHSWPAGHWCTPQHCFAHQWPAPPFIVGRQCIVDGRQCASLAGRRVDSSSSWPAGHWCTPQHCFGEIQQLVLKDTLQTEPQESNQRAFQGGNRACILFFFEQSWSSLV
ncbi:hypothetical protein CsSME_00015931 [Camellia sinensis var. sinensis]